MSFQAHYNISDDEWAKLIERFGDINSRLYKVLTKFDPNGSELPLSRISLMYFADSNGDFSSPKRFSEFVAMAMFNSLESKEKMEVINYISQQEDDDDGSEDNDT